MLCNPFLLTERTIVRLQGGSLWQILRRRDDPSERARLFNNPSLYENLPYDPLKDFKPVTMFASTPHVLVVHPSMPVKSVKALISLASKRPDEIHYGSGGRGSSIHLASALFAYMGTRR
jgi:hypothetical protein